MDFQDFTGFQDVPGYFGALQGITRRVLIEGFS
jgi:hypothetical protein